MDRDRGYSDFKPLIDLFVTLAGERLGAALVSVVLYGSVARETARPDSDIDLLIILKEASPVYYERLQPILDIVRQMRQMPAGERAPGKEGEPYFSFLILSQEEASENRYIFLDMVDEALVLVDQNGFFEGRLERLRGRLRELGARRVHVDGNWYWDLKPDLKPGEVLVL